MNRFILLPLTACLLLSTIGPASAQAGAAPSHASAPSAIPMVLVNYRHYDFVPGETIVFADDLAATADGQFPPHWELLKGHAEVNRKAGQPALALTEGSPSSVAPRIKSKRYLGSQFNIEYDTIMESGATPLLLQFDGGHHAATLTVTPAAAIFDNGDGLRLAAPLPEFIANDRYIGGWRHIAIAVKDKRLKLYVDQFPMLDIPDIKSAPVSLSMVANPVAGKPVLFRDLRITSGESLHLAGEKFTGATIVTHGINFENDTTTLRPESMGTLTQIGTLLKDNPDLRFEIDTFTGSSGDPAHDLLLSQQRADVLRAEFANLGIAPGRLVAKGLGQARPLAPDDTPEGKAANCRVEFVKLN
jgi:OOP family OmpA-OmpF porin